jgi:hypothetical protein
VFYINRTPDFVGDPTADILILESLMQGEVLDIESSKGISTEDPAVEAAKKEVKRNCKIYNKKHTTAGIR